MVLVEFGGDSSHSEFFLFDSKVISLRNCLRSGFRYVDLERLEAVLGVEKVKISDVSRGKLG